MFLYCVVLNMMHFTGAVERRAGVSYGSRSDAAAADDERGCHGWACAGEPDHTPAER